MIECYKMMACVQSGRLTSSHIEYFSMRAVKRSSSSRIEVALIHETTINLTNVMYSFLMKVEDAAFVFQ